MDPAGGDTLKFDDDFLSALLSDPGSLTSIYERDPARFRTLIENDLDAVDVIAFAAKRQAVSEFRTMLHDPTPYSENSWQAFFESNPWILGVGLSSHLFTAWDKSKLERYVAGASISAAGKRVDALLTTSGVVRSIVLAEIKLPLDPLVTDRYRSGTWSVSKEVAGGVAQAHVTAERARDDIGRALRLKDPDGYNTREEAFLVQPRSYLVIGSLESLTRNGNVHDDMFRSFELFRRNLHPPIFLPTTKFSPVPNGQWLQCCNRV